MNESTETEYFDTELGLIFTGLPKDADIFLRFNDKVVSEAGLSQNLKESRHFVPHQKLDV